MGSVHARFSFPSTSTLQAPQLASSHPYLQPVSRSTSRRYQSSGISGSPVWRKWLPLMATSTPSRIGVGVMVAGGFWGVCCIGRLYAVLPEGALNGRCSTTAHALHAPRDCLLAGSTQHLLAVSEPP